MVASLDAKPASSNLGRRLFTMHLAIQGLAGSAEDNVPGIHFSGMNGSIGLFLDLHITI